MVVAVVCIPSVQASWIDIQAAVQSLVDLQSYKTVASVGHGHASAVDTVVGIAVVLMAGKELAVDPSSPFPTRLGWGIGRTIAAVVDAVDAAAFEAAAFERVAFGAAFDGLAFEAGCAAVGSLG